MGPRLEHWIELLPLRAVVVVGVSVMMSAVLGTAARGSSEGSELIGRPAAEWDAGRWFNSKPLTVKELRGRVILVRWFMAPSCPLCSATAPALNRLWHRYRGRGLVVVGMYHHKDSAPLDPLAVQGYIRHFGFEFPVAIDPEWRTLHRWWLDGQAGHERAFTSVSFLIGRDGRIRAVHPGGPLAPDSTDYASIERKIEALLAEKS
jgi:peroxiredoxin